MYYWGGTEEPAEGNGLRQKHDNAQISPEKFIYYAGKKEENNFYSAFLMKLPNLKECPHFWRAISERMGWNLFLLSTHYNKNIP